MRMISSIRRSIQPNSYSQHVNRCLRVRNRRNFHHCDRFTFFSHHPNNNNGNKKWRIPTSSSFFSTSSPSFNSNEDEDKRVKGDNNDDDEYVLQDIPLSPFIESPESDLIGFGKKKKNQKQQRNKSHVDDAEEEEEEYVLQDVPMSPFIGDSSDQAVASFSHQQARPSQSSQSQSIITQSTPDVTTKNLPNKLIQEEQMLESWAESILLSFHHQNHHHHHDYWKEYTTLFPSSNNSTFKKIHNAQNETQIIQELWNKINKIMMRVVNNDENENIDAVNYTTYNKIIQAFLIVLSRSSLNHVGERSIEQIALDQFRMLNTLYYNNYCDNNNNNNLENAVNQQKKFDTLYEACDFISDQIIITQKNDTHNKDFFNIDLINTLIRCIRKPNTTTSLQETLRIFKMLETKQKKAQQKKEKDQSFKNPKIINTSTLHSALQWNSFYLKYFNSKFFYEFLSVDQPFDQLFDHYHDDDDDDELNLNHLSSLIKADILTFKLLSYGLQNQLNPAGKQLLTFNNDRDFQCILDLHEKLFEQILIEEEKDSESSKDIIKTSLFHQDQIVELFELSFQKNYSDDDDDDDVNEKNIVKWMDHWRHFEECLTFNFREKDQSDFKRMILNERQIAFNKKDNKMKRGADPSFLYLSKQQQQKNNAPLETNTTDEILDNNNNDNKYTEYKKILMKDAQRLESWYEHILSRLTSENKENVRITSIANAIQNNIHINRSRIHAWLMTNTLEGVLKAEEIAYNQIQNSHDDNATSSSSSNTEELLNQYVKPIVFTWAQSGDLLGVQRVQEWLQHVQNMNLPKNNKAIFEDAVILAWKNYQTTLIHELQILLEEEAHNNTNNFIGGTTASTTTSIDDDTFFNNDDEDDETHHNITSDGNSLFQLADKHSTKKQDSVAMIDNNIIIDEESLSKAESISKKYKEILIAAHQCTTYLGDLCNNDNNNNNNSDIDVENGRTPGTISTSLFMNTIDTWIALMKAQEYVIASTKEQVDTTSSLTSFYNDYNQTHQVSMLLENDKNPKDSILNPLDQVFHVIGLLNQQVLHDMKNNKASRLTKTFPSVYTHLLQKMNESLKASPSSSSLHYIPYLTNMEEMLFVSDSLIKKKKEQV